MFINHIVANALPLPQMGPYLYEYILAGNGVFVRAQRPEMDALIWIASTHDPVRGLAVLAPSVRIERVPARTVARLFEMAYRAESKEILFYLSGSPWTIQVPDQVQSGAAVRPVDPFAGGASTAIEVHSHHHMGCFFSSTDNQEEQAGFRIYAVIGNLEIRPSILTRVGIFGHFYNIPSAWVFDLPAGVTDALYPDEPDEYEEIEYLEDHVRSIA